MTDAPEVKMTDYDLQLLAAFEDFLDCRIMELVHSALKQPSLADPERTKRARERWLSEIAKGGDS